MYRKSCVFFFLLPPNQWVNEKLFDSAGLLLHRTNRILTKRQTKIAFGFMCWVTLSYFEKMLSIHKMAQQPRFQIDVESFVLHNGATLQCYVCFHFDNALHSGGGIDDGDTDILEYGSVVTMLYPIISCGCDCCLAGCNKLTIFLFNLSAITFHNLTDFHPLPSPVPPHLQCVFFFFFSFLANGGRELCTKCHYTNPMIRALTITV